MNPIVGSLISYGTYKLLYWLFSSDEHSSISAENVFDCSVKVFKNSNFSTVKRSITKNINLIIADCSAFKIGKSGDTSNRKNNPEYRQYEQMYLLAKSKHKDFIEHLEAYYTTHYHTNTKCNNINEGSAGVMTDKTGWYYLYLVVA